MPCDYSKYPKDWPAIRQRILKRAGQNELYPAQCEKCHIHDHAVGYRDVLGRFQRNAGNVICDASGIGQDWPTGRLSYATAKAIAYEYNCCWVDNNKTKCDDDGNHWFVVVLTIAHVDNADPADCRDENLMALCQACHNALDARTRAARAKATRAQKTLAYANDTPAVGGGAA